ncbi:MAG: hypothetical protein V3S11_03825, partial [Elusimicrobiota bacterium]
MKKGLLVKILGGTIVLAAFAVFFAAMQLNVIVKAAIEKGGRLREGGDENEARRAPLVRQGFREGIPALQDS